MPKEVIAQCDDVYLAVQWGRRGDENNRGDANPEPSLTTWRQEVDPDGRQAQLVPDGTSWVLDRDGVNRLIRTLRRARDMAFGSDE